MIRIATQKDIPSIISLLYSYYGKVDGYYSSYEPDEVYVTNNLSLIMQNSNVDILIDGGCKGIAIVEYGPEWFTKRNVATEKLVLVHPDHRRSTTFLRLVRAMERWAKDRHCYALWTGVSTNEEPDRIANAYLRMGYTASGRMFLKLL